MTCGFFLLILLSGYRVTNSGKPYSMIILSIHKLLSVGTLAYLALSIWRASRVQPLAVLQWLAIGSAFLLFLVTILTGGFLSMEKDMPAVLKTVHHILPYATAATPLVTLFLLA